MALHSTFDKTSTTQSLLKDVHNAPAIMRLLENAAADEDWWRSLDRARSFTQADSARAAAEEIGRARLRGGEHYRAIIHQTEYYADSVSLRDAVRALLAWDDCAALLDLPSEAVKFLSVEGDKPSLLLYAAVAALEGSYDPAVPTE